MAVYLVRQEGAVINRIEWDGVTPYDPGEGRTLEPEAAPEPDAAEAE
ncbi:hypothetical protein [Sphingomonas pituitosa]|nr:hypothetical protein [Sphingomonas pituitosa]